MRHNHTICIFLITIIGLKTSTSTSDGRNQKYRQGSNSVIASGRDASDSKKPSKEVDKPTQGVVLTKEAPLTEDLLYIYNLTYGGVQENFNFQLKDSFDNPVPILQNKTMKPISFLKVKGKGNIEDPNDPSNGISYFIKIGAKVALKGKVEQKYFHVRYYRGGEELFHFSMMLTGIEKNKYYTKEDPIKPFGVFKNIPDEYDPLKLPKLKTESILYKNLKKRHPN